MASNPMQRKSRLYFLIGMLSTLLVAIIIIVIMYNTMSKTIQETQTELSHFTGKSVYVLNQDVKAGQIIDPEQMLEKMTVDDRTIPQGATSDLVNIEDQALTDTEGNPITVTISNGESKYTISYGSGNTKELKLADIQEQETGGKIFYYEEGGQRVFVETATDPLIAKINMSAKTVVTNELIARGPDTLTKDARWQEYGMISLPSDLISGDMVDIRLQLPTGEDFIVLPKKKVLFPGTEENEVPTTITDVIRLSMSEAETLTMNSAIVDSYQIMGSKLYAVKYTNPGIQDEAKGTYYPSNSTIQLISKDPNVITRAISELNSRVTEGAANEFRNNYINSAIQDSATSGGQENIQTKQQESVTKAQQTRQTYLSELAGE